MEINWQSLRDLRSDYVRSKGFLKDYWTPQLLKDYHQTLGQRISWKWQAVLTLIQDQGFMKDEEKLSLLDLGCGTGVAALSFVDAFPNLQFDSIHLWDRSPKAREFAKLQLKDKTSETKIECSLPKSSNICLVSHVLTEMDDQQLSDFMEQVTKSDHIFWVDAGTSFVSKRLIQIRQKLLSMGYEVKAPCNHQNQCGMLAEGNEDHWCHFFAEPPQEAHQSAFWRDFAKQLKVDLRSLPVSFLVMSRRSEKTKSDDSRVIGRVREYKGFCKALLCNESGVSEQDIQKRDDKKVFKKLCKGGFCMSHEGSCKS